MDQIIFFINLKSIQGINLIVPGLGKHAKVRAIKLQIVIVLSFIIC